jgi:hypothetical protein
VTQTIAAGAAAVAMLAAGSALADDANNWTLTGGASRTFSDKGVSSSDVDAFSVSLERAFGATSAGFGGGVSWREYDFPDSVSLVDTSNYSLGGWIAHGFGVVDASLYVDYASETEEFVYRASGGQEFPAAGRNEFLSVAASASRTFGGSTRIAPEATIGWSRIDASISLDPLASALAGLSLSQTSDAVFGSLGASFAHDATGWLTLYAGASAAASDNTAAVYHGPGELIGQGTAPRSFGTSGSDVWGEFSGGVVITTKRTTHTLGVAATTGLEGDYVAASISTAIHF